MEFAREKNQLGLKNRSKVGTATAIILSIHST